MINLKQSTQLRYLTMILLKTFGVLVGAMLVAVQTRLNYTYGRSLGDDYQAHNIPLYLLMLAAVGLTIGLFFWLSRWRPTLLHRQWWIMLSATGLSIGLIAVLLPDISQLQLVYYAIASFVFSFLVSVLPNLLGGIQRVNLLESLQKLWDYRVLLLIWMKYNVLSRYSQTVLGILWIVLLPLSTAMVLAFVFSQFFRLELALNVPFISFFLAALVPWTFFQQGVQNGTQSVLNMLGLINQIYFPREILVIVTLGEALVDLTFMFVAMILINAAYGIWPNLLYIYLPLLALIQAAFMLGIMLFVSCLSVMIRDIPQLVAVILQLLFYLSPILYPVDFIPQQYQFILAINPLVPLFEAYRNIILENKLPDFSTLYYPLVFSGIMLFLGYVYLKANEDRLADLI